MLQRIREIDSTNCRSLFAKSSMIFMHGPLGLQDPSTSHCYLRVNFASDAVV